MNHYWTDDEQSQLAVGASVIGRNYSFVDENIDGEWD
jgi:hypothetical protein